MNTQHHPFDAPPIDVLPDIACIGIVEEVGDGKESESKDYFVQPIRIKGVAGSRNATVQFLYRPEWLTPSFRVASFEELSEARRKSFTFVYGKNVYSRSKTSNLSGLSGSDDNFAALAELLKAIPEAERLNPMTVTTILRRFFREHESEKIGYVLTQKREKIESEDGGKPEYVRAPGYEIGSWFRVDDEGLKRIAGRAARSTDKSFIIGFDTDVPF